VPNPAEINAWSDFIVKGAAAFGIAWALWFSGRKLWVRVARSIRHSDAMHEKFGPSPAEALHALIDKLRVDAGRLEIVQTITSHQLDLPVYICDINGKCTFANEALCRLFRMSRDEMLTWGWMRVISPEEAEHVYQQWASFIATGRPYKAFYHVHGKKCMTEAFPTRVDGEIRSYVGYVAPSNE
jgi:PAS domain S-box-containing protein